MLVEKLELQRAEEALGDAVVEAVADRAHRTQQTGGPETPPERPRRVLVGFNWSSQHLDRGGGDGQTCGVVKELTGRSPGAPALRREIERQFWREIVRGLLAEEAAIAVGVSPAAGARWFRHGGGMPSIDLAPLSGRYLSFREREEIALLRAGGAGVRAIARQLGRAPSTISRELRRNAATRCGKLDYRPSVAQ